jgi:hypothetical protein
MSFWLAGALPLLLLAIVLLFGFSGCSLILDSPHYASVRAGPLRLTLHRPRHTRISSIEFTFHYGSASSSMSTDVVTLTFETVSMIHSPSGTYTSRIGFLLEREDTEFTVIATEFDGRLSSVSVRLVYFDTSISPIASDPVAVSSMTTAVEWEVLPVPTAGEPPPLQTITPRPIMTMPTEGPPRMTFKVRNQRGVGAVDHVLFNLNVTPAGGPPQTVPTRLRKLDWFDTVALTHSPVGLLGGRIDVALAQVASNSLEEYELFIRPLPPDTGWPLAGDWRVVPAVGDLSGAADVRGPEATLTVPPPAGDALEVSWDVPAGAGSLVLVRS